MLNTPSSKVCSLLLTQPFPQAMSPLPSSLDSSASSFSVFPCPLRIRHRNPHSLRRERSQSGSTLPGRPLLAPGPGPISTPGQLPRTWQHSPGGGQRGRGEKEEGPQCRKGRVLKEQLIEEEGGTEGRCEFREM